MSKCSNISLDLLIFIDFLLSILLSQDLNIDEINVLGNFLTQIGANLLAKAAQQQNLQSKEELKNQIADMEQQLEKLKKDLC
ncbi:MAG: hypothetical protein GX347_09330 [Epulopiscium sp.]|nr:hypothetical protein [Candidatus Epulonipiscium sp.]